MTLQISPLPGLAYQLTGCQNLFLWRPSWLQRQRDSLIYWLKERGPAVCRYTLIKSSQTMIGWHRQTHQIKLIKNIWLWKEEAGLNNGSHVPSVISCLRSFVWCGCDSSAGINQTCKQMASHSSGRLGIKSFFPFPPELVIGLLCHGAEHANSHRVVLLLWLLMWLWAPFHSSESCSTLIKKAWWQLNPSKGTQH